MSQVHLSDRVLARIIKRTAEAARANPNASQSALLNLAACEIAGDGHDWGLVKNAEVPLLSRDLSAVSGPAQAPQAKAEEGPAVAYLYQATISYISGDDDLGDCSLEDIAYQIDEGSAIGGALKITRTPVASREARDAIAVSFGSDGSFFFDEDRLEAHRMVAEVACLTDFEDLEEDDLDEDGMCRVDGSYSMKVMAPVDTQPSLLAEMASIHFHEKVKIACPDDFHILFRPRRYTEEDSDFREDLGAITVTEERLQELFGGDSPSL